MTKIKTSLLAIKSWLYARLSERSTWVGIGLAIAAAAVLPSPWSYLSCVVGTIGALVSDNQKP